MTIHELHNLFYAEYDKGTSITSYPNFTHNEIDIWLNKALLMLINQKFTGNNVRRVGFEGDNKRLSDLQKLVTIQDLSKTGMYNNISNAAQYTLPSNFMLYVGGYLNIKDKHVPTDLIEHQYIKLFTSTTYNSPWIKRPKVTIEDNTIITLFDNSLSYSDIGGFSLNYIKFPNEIDYDAIDSTKSSSLTDRSYDFQFDNNLAQEVINTAILLALGNIESEKTAIASSTIKIEE